MTPGVRSALLFVFEVSAHAAGSALRGWGPQHPTAHSCHFYFLCCRRLPSLWKRKRTKAKQVPPRSQPCRKEKGVTAATRRRNPAWIPKCFLFLWLSPSLCVVLVMQPYLNILAKM